MASLEARRQALVAHRGRMETRRLQLRAKRESALKTAGEICSKPQTLALAAALGAATGFVTAGRARHRAQCASEAGAQRERPGEGAFTIMLRLAPLLPVLLSLLNPADAAAAGAGETGVAD